MKYKSVGKILIGLLFITALNVNSQSFGSKVRFFDIEDGLSRSGINDLFIDSRGFLWIATADGLNRYDGIDFISFKHIPSDTTSICDNYIRNLCEDSEGNIWIATANGLSCFRRRFGNFQNFFHDIDNIHSIASNNIYKVYCDHEGIIWVNTVETLEKFNPKTNRFTHYQHFNNVFNYALNDFLFPIFEDSKGRLWIGTKDGLCYFDKNLELFKYYQFDPKNIYSLSNNSVRAINEDKSGNLWIGTDNGLNLFNTNTGKFFRFFHNPNQKNSLINNEINDIYVDDKGILWIATMDGYCSFDYSRNIFSSCHSIEYRNADIPLTEVSSILIDKSKNLWIGSFEGLTKIDLKPFKFGLFPSNGVKYQYDIVSVRSIDNQNVLVGTRNKGLLLLKRTNAFSPFYIHKTFNSLSSKTIFSIFPVNQNFYWIGTSNGLYELDINKGTVQNVTVPNVGNDFFYNNRIFSFFKDKNGKLWIGSEYGLHQYDFKSGKWNLFVQIPDSQGISVRTARCFAFDKEENLWIGTDDGLICYNIDSKAYKKYLSNPGKSVHSLPINNIYSLLYTRNNQLWIGTNAGLCKYNPSSDDFTVFTELEGLPNNTIYSLLEDNKGNIWFSTNRGLIELSPSSELFTTFDLADGLQGYEFNIGSSSHNSKGEFFFGGINGLNYFCPDSLKPNLYEPYTEITRVDIISKGIKKYFSISRGMELVIPANTKMFTIYFSALDFTYPANNKYMYKLSSPISEGLWINLGSKNFVQFSNLKPGTYTLWVKGSNSDQIWSRDPYSIKLIIETPFYKSRIAYVLYFIILIVSVFSSIRWRTNKLVKENKILHEKEQASLEINRQKEELTVKNKNITDSINYARMIQIAIFPSERNFKKILPVSFIFHKPKDIVSGDFYWIHEKEGKIFVVVADCTGHGVPGAFMSILGIELFSNLTNTNIDDPGILLTRLNEEFARVFAGMDEYNLKDGMDVSFCIIDKEKYLLHFAGAQHSMYHVANDQIYELQGDRFSISNEKKEESFKTQTVQLNKNDMLYLFTDGFADQFGGPEDKKFKYRRFRHLLLNINKLPVDQQKDVLEETFEVWKGSQDQVDDILVIGIRAEF
jgi:ligand-binding sensor domain-containing protein/serine phosphatase RsbU (regulator of sigma subunit)